MTRRATDDLAINRLAARLVGLERQVRGLSLPSLSFSAVEGGGIDLRDKDGNLIGRVGELPDGSGGGVISVNGPRPAKPSAPIVTPIQGGLAVTWDGVFADGTTASAAFARMEIHVGTVSGFYTGSADSLKATIESPRGGTVAVVPLARETKYVVLVARSLAGAHSFPSVEVVSTPGSVISDAEREQILADLAANQTAINQLNTDLAATNTELDAAGVKADQALTTANGKGKAYHQPTPPASGTEHDIWFDTDNGHLPHRWDGATWVQEQFGTAAFAAGSITAASGIIGSLDAGKITTGSMNASFILAGSIGTDRMTANSINGDRIAANTLHADKIVANTITADRILAGTLTSVSGVFGVISADHITTGKLSADRIDGGTINGQTINGGTFQTATGGQRIVITGTGTDTINFYNSGGTNTASIQGASNAHSAGLFINAPQVSGNVGIRLQGTRITLAAPGSGTPMATFEGTSANFGSTPTVGGTAVSLNGHGHDYAATSHGHDYAATNHSHTYPVTSVNGRTGAVSGLAESNHGHDSATWTEIRLTTGLYGRSGTTNYLMVAATGNPVLWSNGGDTRIAAGGSNVVANRDIANTKWVPSTASAFTVNSSRENKTDVTAAPAALDGLRKMRPVMYRRVGDPPTKPKVRGFIAEEVRSAVADVVQDITITVGENNDQTETSPGLDLAAMISLAIQGIQELSARVDQIAPPAAR